MNKTGGSTEKLRKTLLEQASESNVRDPAAHAKRQVEELDKTAKRSQLRRRLTQESIEADDKEIAQLHEQIEMLLVRYDPLVEHLNDSMAKKKELEQILEHCLKDQKNIMGNVKGVIFERRIEDSKNTKKMGSYELEKLRGYNLKPESTFYQGKGFNSTSTFKEIFSEDKIDKDLKKTRNQMARHAASMAALPPLSSTSNSHSIKQMTRNKSSTM
jgi:hypothetical protein